MPVSVSYNLALEELDKLYFRSYLQISRTGFMLRWEKGSSAWQTAASDLDQLGYLILGWVGVRRSRKGNLVDYAERIKPSGQ